MAEGEETLVAAARTHRSATQVALRGVLVLFAVLLVGLAIVWFSREEIAENVIAEQIEANDLPATYDIESIGPSQQVLSNVVIGDAAAPDLTIDRVSVNLDFQFGFPSVGRIELINPRLFGRISPDGVSFGSLDKVLFAESDDPPALPAFDIKLVDGRARIESPWGTIGVKANGEGRLDDGFTGTLAAIAPQFAFEGCNADRITLFGKVAVADGAPSFSGPARMSQLACEELGVDAGQTDLSLALVGDPTLDGFDAEIEGGVNALAAAGLAVGDSAVDARLTLRDGRIVSRYDIAMNRVAAEAVALSQVNASGTMRSDAGFAQIQSDLELRGEDIALSDQFGSALASAQQSASGSLIEPLLARLRRAINQGVEGGGISADLTLRRMDGAMTAVAPRIALRSQDGTTLAALSRVQARFDGGSTPRIAGNIRIGGAGLPQISGRMERGANGQSQFRLRMAPYEAQGSRLAIPDLRVAQLRDGSFTVDGTMLADGPLPGGEARGLSLPITGTIAASGDVRMWNQCTPIAFRTLSYAELTLENQELTLCPANGAPILRYDRRGLALAAGVPGLALTGSLAGTPVQLSSGPVGFAWPGQLIARELDLVLGPQDNAARFKVTNLDADLGSEIAGTIADADIRLDAVPLDILQANGRWSYIDGVLQLDEGAFIVEDRAEEDLFNPLHGRDATLRLENSRISAQALLREPSSDRPIVDLTLRHNLSGGVGSADLNVAGVRFDEALQPVDLSDLAIGVIALADGVVTGTGRIDWNDQDITSSGQFSTKNFDFAAAFGPVEGASGTINFTDLLTLTTAPDQRLFVKSINPGIEVNDGVIRFALRDGQILDVAGGEWPWLGGRLTMRPVLLNFSRPETRRYAFEVEGVEAALFIERLELANLSARGTFDGTISVVFDEVGNGFIEDGLLLSRAPGGNLSYVGELTYEDMGAIANFAFNSLRSLDYRQMRIGVDGPLTGEIVTRVTFEGVSQGEGASRNFVTRRLGKLPIRFNVNIRAPFYQLLTNVRSIYDPAFVRDPREVGLLTDDGTEFRQPDVSAAQPPIQDPESEDRP
ncbi:exoprotein [Erythrobacter jejuensis]|uniref:Exoprotein n=2 Tax=Parerythrobacter jejuensis TaxID=795812 RepID=A0A845ATZ7_9SPHN|nr:exoprotein [Parerythrobacter jejuensis]